MNFLEISDGIIVDIDKVEAIIQDTKKPGCKVYISGISYASILPINVVKNLINNKKDVEKAPEQVQEQMLNILKQQTNVMGG